MLKIGDKVRVETDSWENGIIGTVTFLGKVFANDFPDDVKIMVESAPETLSMWVGKEVSYEQGDLVKI